jgi:hypothetical protein
MAIGRVSLTTAALLLWGMVLPLELAANLG